MTEAREYLPTPETLRNVFGMHRAPVPEPIEDPLPDEHPVPQDEPVPSPQPQ